MNSNLREELAHFLCARKGVDWHKLPETARDLWRNDADAALNFLANWAIDHPLVTQ